MVREQLALAPTELRRRLDPASLDFESTAEVEPLQGTINRFPDIICGPHPASPETKWSDFSDAWRYPLGAAA